MLKSRVAALICLVLICLVFPGMLISGIPGTVLAANEVMIIELEGSINPGTAMYVKRGIMDAREQGIELCIIRLDTPGGLGSSMRTIIKAILNSPIPVVVYVGPKGAGAASAGGWRTRPRRPPNGTTPCAPWSSSTGRISVR